MKILKSTKLRKLVAPCIAAIIGLSSSSAADTPKSGGKDMKKATPVTKKAATGESAGGWPPDDWICMIIDCGDDDGPIIIVPSILKPKK